MIPRIGAPSSRGLSMADAPRFPTPPVERRADFALHLCCLVARQSRRLPISSPTRTHHSKRAAVAHNTVGPLAPVGPLPQPENAVRLKTWTGDPLDFSLLDLAPFLDALAKEESNVCHARNVS